MENREREGTMKEQQFRNKVIWFTFVFSLFVIWVHSYNAELYLGKTPQAARLYQIEHWIGEGIGQIAVPGFFMISAFLFYRGFSWNKLITKWDLRVRSVLLPFILWNFLYYIGYVIGSRIPWLTDVVEKGTVPFNLSALVDAVLHYTYNYVFWYLYQLILLILLAPVLYLLLNKWWVGIVFQLCLWGLMLARIDLGQLNLDALIYYSFAAFLGLHGRKTVEAGGSRIRLATGVLLIVLGGVVYYMALVLASPPLLVLCRLLMVTGLWTAVPGERLPEPKQWMTCNFFLYATHFALVRLINKIGARILPALLPVPLLLYLLLPLIALAVSYPVGKLLRYRLPRIWNLLNGGR